MAKKKMPPQNIYRSSAPSWFNKYPSRVQMNQLQQMFAAMMDTSVKGRQHGQNEDQQEVRHNEEFFSVPPSQAVVSSHADTSFQD